MGELKSIWIKPAKGEPMNAADAASLVTGKGIEGNYNQGGKRQVTIIEQENWEKMMEELGADLCASTRRANFLVQDIGLEESAGQILQIGDIKIHIRGETVPCGQMDASYQGLRDAMVPEWRGGAYGEVLDDGEVKVGDAVRWMRD